MSIEKRKYKYKGLKFAFCKVKQKTFTKVEIADIEIEGFDRGLRCALFISQKSKSKKELEKKLKDEILEIEDITTMLGRYKGWENEKEGKNDNK